MAGVIKESGAWEDAEPGVRRKILQAQGGLMLMEVQFAAGAAGYVHNHVHEQISYCTAGRFEYSLDGRIRVPQGDSIYVDNARHGAKALAAGTLIDVFLRCARTCCAVGAEHLDSMTRTRGSSDNIQSADA
jgi:quercetin dioxygenase-like cupin family protein